MPVPTSYALSIRCAWPTSEMTTTFSKLPSRPTCVTFVVICVYGSWSSTCPWRSVPMAAGGIHSPANWYGPLIRVTDPVVGGIPSIVLNEAVARYCSHPCPRRSTCNWSCPGIWRLDALGTTTSLAPL